MVRILRLSRIQKWHEDKMQDWPCYFPTGQKRSKKVKGCFQEETALWGTAFGEELGKGAVETVLFSRLSMIIL